MKSFAVFFASAMLVLMLVVCGSNAQEKPSVFGHPARPASPEQVVTSQTAAAPGLTAQAWGWILTQQSALNRQLAGAVKDLKTANPLHATFVLALISFGYGVLHAAGPGHGKAIISSYVLANEETVRRGIALSFLAAIFQALSAIIFVGVLSLVLHRTGMQMKATEAAVETVSWALVALVGAWLLYRQARDHWPASWTRSLTSHSAHAPGHHHHDDHKHVHAHDHPHQHSGASCSCGHSHMPDPSQLAGAWSWRKALPLALSVGVRPCSGAIILLIFAMSQGLLWAGILGTFAMAIGTAITVSALAALAVGSRDFARRMSGPSSVWAQRITLAAGFAGAAAVFLMGTAFFFVSLKGGAPL